MKYWIYLGNGGLGKRYHPHSLWRTRHPQSQQRRIGWFKI